MGKGKKERYEVRNLLAQFLAKGQGVEVRERLLQQVVAHVNQGGTQQRIEHIDELASSLAKRCLKNGVLGEEEKNVLREVAEQLFKREELEVFLRLYEKLFQKADFDFLVSALALQVFGATTFAKDIETTGRFFFLGMFFEVAGSTLERAIQFGLFLLEQHRSIFQKVVDRWDELKARRLHAFPEALGEHVRQLLESGSSRPRDALLERLRREVPGVISGRSEISILVLHASWRGAPRGLINAARNWVDQLINALDDNTLAEEVLESVIGVLNSTHPTMPSHYQCEFHPVKRGKELEFAILKAREALTRVSSRGGEIAAFFEPIRCYVTAEQSPIIERWQARLQRRREAEISRGNQALEWLERQRPWLEGELERKRALIQSQPRRGLRPNGADHIDIEVAPLFNAGIRGLVFYPDGRKFPNVRIELLQRRETPHLVSFSFEMMDFQVQRLRDFIGDEKTGSGRPTVAQFKFLIEVVIVDLLYTIVVEGKEPRQRKVAENDQEQNTGPRPIRPHYRRLLPHQHASERAKDRARQTYSKSADWQLPEGVTFVKARYRDGQLEYNYPTGPIGVYADRDLFNSGRSS